MIDTLIIEIQSFLRTNFREHEGDEIIEKDLLPEKKKNAVSIMRVNHCGEVCAQALYRAQILFAQSSTFKSTLQQMADEELEHLIITKRRLNELLGKQSKLNPLFYISSFILGSIFAAKSDQLSRGFLKETEKQVQLHLKKFILKAKEIDPKSEKILSKMLLDEAKHEETASLNDYQELSNFSKKIMAKLSKVMVYTTSKF